MAASRSPRDDLDLFERLSRVDAAAISDAEKSLRILPPAIRPVSANARLVGRAVTADAPTTCFRSWPASRPPDPGTSWSSAPMARLTPWSASSSRMRSPARSCRTRAGRLLPRQPKPATGEPADLRARGHAATAKAAPSVNIPLTIEGVRVNPGNLLAGDEDGIPVATAGELTAVVHAAETIQFTEEALVSSMTDGVSLFNKLNFAEHVRKVSASQDSSLQFLV
jgi:4-hydroxy-4-methyl-2-oxoglutarate aldolase